MTLLGTARINFFAITEGRSITLVDCGFKGHWRYLKAWLESTNRSISDIEAIVLTHGHADHVGFAQYLANLGVPVHLHHADIEHASLTGIKPVIQEAAPSIDPRPRVCSAAMHS